MTILISDNEIFLCERTVAPQSGNSYLGDADFISNT